MVHCYEEKVLFVLFFGILAFFQAGNSSNWLNFVLSTVFLGFSSSYMYQMPVSESMTMLHHIWENQFVAWRKHSAGKFYPMRLTHQTWLFSITTCLHRWVTHLLSSALIRTRIFRKWLDKWFAAKRENNCFWCGIHKLPEKWEIV